jgi:hypothetical protein
LRGGDYLVPCQRIEGGSGVAEWKIWTGIFCPIFGMREVKVCQGSSIKPSNVRAGCVRELNFRFHQGP